MQLKEGKVSLSLEYNETTGYASDIVSFAQRWAEKMEELLLQGEPLQKIIGIARVSTEGVHSFSVQDQLIAQKIILESWLYGEEMESILLQSEILT